MSNVASGEFFDLTITSFNNAFGEKKIKGSLEYGLTPPLQKYIDELLMIIPSNEYPGAQGTPGTSDDKTPKRIARVNFLKIINNYKIFQNYFTEMMKYLNGLETNDDFSNNYLIFSIAGGNIIVIFIKLLWELYQYIRAINNNQVLPSLSIFNKNFIQKYKDEYFEVETIFNYIQNNEQFILLWQELSSKSFSDFDYNLLPSPQLAYQVKQLNCSSQDKSSAGFVLFRIKTLIENGVKLPPKISKGKDICKNLLINNKSTQDLDNGDGFTWDMYKKLFAQGVQQNFINSLDNFTEDEEKNKEKCINFIKYLLAQKKSIEDETKLNVKVAGSLFQKGYSYEQSTMKGPETINIIQGVESEVGSFMNYLHTVTRVINTYIYYWEKGKIKNADGGLRIGQHNEELSNLLASFCSLNTILESRVLMRLSSDIINYFLNLPCTPGNISPCSEIILEKIIEQKKQQGLNNVKMGPSKLVLIPNNSFIYTQLSKVERYLRRTQYSELGYPDGINITLNAIETEPIATIDAMKDTLANANITLDTAAFDEVKSQDDLPNAIRLNEVQAPVVEYELSQHSNTITPTLGGRRIIKKVKKLKTRKKLRKINTKKNKTKNIKRKTRVFKRKN